MRCSLLLPSFTLFALAVAHSTYQRRAPTPEELAREEIHARERVIMTRNCEPEIRDHMAMRMRRRSEMLKREAEAAGASIHVARATAPHYQNIQNTTCVLAPEVTEGPEYINNELVRQDVRETQPGVLLLMDIGVMDISTCTPMNNTFVEIWNTNSAGDYSGYEDPSMFNGTEYWLRGGWYTDLNGMVEFTTVYPGFYWLRAPHIHVMVHKDLVQSENGTLVSHSGTVLHIGQTFFPEEWNDKVYATSPYTSNINQRTTNGLDTILAQASRDGYSAITTIQYLNGIDLSGGLVGYITVGVNPSSSQTITSGNYSGTVSQANLTGNLNGSAASTHAPGWGNAFYLSLLMFAFFAYTYVPDYLRS